MVFTVEDRTTIKFLRETKKYGARRLMSEFPTKQWSLAGLNRLLRKIDTTGSAKRRPGQGRKRSVRTQENIDNVGDLVLSQDNNP